MNFLVTNEAKLCGVVNPVVCIIKNVLQVKKENCTVYDKPIENLMAKISDIREKTLPTQEVQGFRTLYSNIEREVIPAGEKLLASCEQKNAFPRYGNLVDAYNMVALENVMPLGMHDAKDFLKNTQTTLLFKRASGNETLIPAFQKIIKSIPKGDFTYGTLFNDIFDPYAWLGKEDVDSKKWQVNKKTKNLLFTAIGNEFTTEERNIELCNKVFELIQLSCPQSTMEIYLPTFIE